jgi:hypothetical protein
MFLLHTDEGHPAVVSPATALYKADFDLRCFVWWLLLLECLSICATMFPAENGRLNSTTSELKYSASPEMS